MNARVGRVRPKGILRETVQLAVSAIGTNRMRTILAVVGIVIGIVTVVLMASILANVRNQIALLFRELGTDNVFAFHLSGDPYSPASEREASRRPLEPRFARELVRSESIRRVGIQMIIPNVVNGRPLTARAGVNESDAVLVEGSSPNSFEVAGAEFGAGRPFTDLEDRAAARVCVIGANLARALFGNASPLGRTIIMDGETYSVVGVLAPRQGAFFGENRQDNVMSIPVGTAQRLFPQIDRTVLYINAHQDKRELARLEAEVILRRLRGLQPGQPNDFNLSTSDQIIGTFDQLSLVVWLVTMALAGVSLLIGSIGIANVMIISVTERTREIGVRMAIGARRKDVLRQFLVESVILSTLGGVAGVLVAIGIGLVINLFARGFSAAPPAWAVAAGVIVAFSSGVAAGYLPAKRAARLDPVQALRYE